MIRTAGLRSAQPSPRTGPPGLQRWQAAIAGTERRGVCTAHRTAGGRDMSVKQASGDVNGLRWFKSSYSGSGGGDCVEVADGHGAVYVRDSKPRAAGRCCGSAGASGRRSWHLRGGSADEGS
ncbi:DUF397 domain-containing protein [Streptomyces sp. NPDC057429]|uniref:DUF397 domain-containing protein n=1 Tax=Streptomyces sp. NPDC057429 TaxID=3346130 RepID=UPI0036D1F999